MTEPELIDELYDLADAVAENEVTDEQAARLEQLVSDHADLRRLYVNYMHAHASLTWWHTGEAASRKDQPAAETAGEPAVQPLVMPESEPLVAERRRSWRELSWKQLAPYLVSGAVMLAIGVALGLMSVRQQQQAGGHGGFAEIKLIPVATLVKADQCRWENGILPTEPGSELPAGILRLAEGIAHLEFKDGAQIVLEAPSELELTNTDSCLLHRGKLIAHVGPEAVGFAVTSPTAKVVDLGTEFGIHVKSDGSTDVQVFDGRVELEHLPSGQKQNLSAGQAKRVNDGGMSDFNPLVADAGQFEPPPGDGQEPQTVRLVNITSADGAGKDAYIQSSPKEYPGSETLLMVKNTIGTTHRRKAYVGIDLSSIAGSQVREARLAFTIQPTELGFASTVPDSTFTVYGLTDEALDNWKEDTIEWKNAPANLPGGNELDEKKIVRLGSFEIAQGIRHGTRSIGGPKLVEFLNADTNGIVTFILVRETVESGGAGLVHGFASRHHPSADPPTLKLSVFP